MSISTTQSTKQTARRKKIIWVIIVAILLLVLVIDIFLTGYFKYSYHYLRCNGAPVVAVKPDLWAVSGYSLPNTNTYEVRAYNIYYCTSSEAEAAGERPNPFSDEGYQRQEQLRREGKL